MKNLALITGILLVLSLIALAVIPAFDIEYDTVEVTDKTVKIKRSGDSVSDQYLIFTDKGTFTITDTLIHTRWNSSDVYGRIEKGKRYSVKHAGWRVPFFSMYENILTATEIKE